MAKQICPPESIAWIDEALVIGGDPKGKKQFYLRVDIVDKLKKALTEKKIAVISGPSKCGKTWLVRRLLEERQTYVLEIVGQDFSVQDTLWHVLAYTEYWNIDVINKSPARLRKEVTQKLTTMINTQGHVSLYIDDIHFAPPSTLKRLAADLKYLHDMLQPQGLDIIIVGVNSPPHRMFLDSANFPGRAPDIDCSEWEPYELAQIISLGCELNTRGYSLVHLEKMAIEAFSSPSLMISMVRNFLKQECLQPRPTGGRTIITIEEEDIISAAKTVVMDDYTTYQQILRDIFLTARAHGMDSEHQIKYHKTKHGNVLSFNQLFWYIASGTHSGEKMPFYYFKNGVSFTRLNQELDKLLEDPLDWSELLSSLKTMCAYYQKFYSLEEQHKDPIIDLPTEDGPIYVRDPYFLFVCRHSPEIITRDWRQ